MGWSLFQIRTTPLFLVLPVGIDDPNAHQNLQLCCKVSTCGFCRASEGRGEVFHGAVACRRSASRCTGTAAMRSGHAISRRNHDGEYLLPSLCSNHLRKVNDGELLGLGISLFFFSRTCLSTYFIKRKRVIIDATMREPS